MGDCAGDRGLACRSALPAKGFEQFSQVLRDLQKAADAGLCDSVENRESHNHPDGQFSKKGQIGDYAEDRDGGENGNRQRCVRLKAPEAESRQAKYSLKRLGFVVYRLDETGVVSLDGFEKQIRAIGILIDLSRDVRVDIGR
ncbi:hypothetical protein LQ948_16175 [Jiella sp. MQZ9-1]|nr:hypothetical protein [Jiella flava]